MSNIHYTHCPVCGSTELESVLRVKDYTVSGDTFPVVECRSCSLRFTQDVPDASSIGPYYKSEDYISHTNTAKGLVNRLYHLVRKRTLASKRKLVTKQTGLSKGKLLDIGSGTGAFLAEMNHHGWETTGLEPDAGARQVALQHYQVNLQDMNALAGLPAGSYDAVTLWHVLEHVHELHATVRQFHRVLKDTGKLIIAVPNYTSPDAALYNEYWAAYDVPRHLYHFSPRSMQVLMEKNGLQIQHYKTMWYDPFYIAMLSSKYKNGKISWLGSVWNGLRSDLAAMKDVKRSSSVIYIINKKQTSQ
jgi:2-polyprenyl-3-methyl-5-hydroxy-6-metoxy-1,4-benzoquinol methylase